MLTTRYVLEQFQDRRRDGFRCIDLKIARTSPPGFIPAPTMLLGSGQVAVVAVGKFDGERVPEWALLFDLQADFHERFTWAGGNTQVTNADSLYECLDLGGILRHQD